MHSVAWLDREIAGVGVETGTSIIDPYPYAVQTCPNLRIIPESLFAANINELYLCRRTLEGTAQPTPSPKQELHTVNPIYPAANNHPVISSVSIILEPCRNRTFLTQPNPTPAPESGVSYSLTSKKTPPSQKSPKGMSSALSGALTRCCYAQ